jgi:hypothetical protein
MNLRRAEHWERTCDDCNNQEEGKHYCLLHSITVKNMDIMRCEDFEYNFYNVLHQPRRHIL